MSEASRDRTPARVVGIGASAGGLDALERFFDHVPGDTGMAFVVVQHLSPDFKSLMDELLARHTRLPIHLVEDGMPVEADHVYLIPPKKEMIISAGRLLLSERDRQQELTLPIDVFFRSLAQDCGARAVAIVLSGGGSDGSRGVCDVHDAGGLVLVQDLDSAQFDGMPRAATDTGTADWIVPPQEMPGVLLAHLTRASSVASAPGGVILAEPHGIGAVYRMLQEEFGIDFTHYKPSTVTRRIERRLALARSPDLEEYVRHLRSDRDELNVLYHDLLIGVTRFFRDEDAFAILERQVLPDLLRRTPRDAPLRLWVAGCATGEEAYSLAIVLLDLMATLGERPLKIFATDVHRGSLERAARAIYDAEAVTKVSPERLARYFLRIGEAYQVVPDVRQMIVFAQHNVIKDAPFTRVDLIACRNLLIYLQPAAQQKVLSFFHFALNHGGTLFLGPSESVGALARGFEPVDKHWQLYRKHSDARTPVDARLQPLAHAEPRFAPGSLAPPGGRYSVTQLLGAYDTLLEELMPPSLLVTDRGELVHAFGGASRFLRPRDGRQALDVLELVEPELKMVLIGGLKRALGEPSAIVFRGVRLGTGGEAGVYKVTLRRIRNRASGVLNVLVSLDPMQDRTPRAADAETEIDLDQISRQQLGTLEAELSRTRENLQAAIEELEASNEELQASNEELQSSNEELQSTNEELQSVNEELYTVNAEYQRKIAELTELTNDMDNLLASTEVGTIFLDPQLKIRRFTPEMAERFGLVAHDVGRSIETFGYRMEHPDLIEDLRRVLVTGRLVERELPRVDGKSFFSRILPYRVKGTVEGVVLTLIDVTGLKEAQDKIQEAVRRRDQFLAMLSHELRNPLGAIVTATSMLRGADGAAALKPERLFDILDRQSQQMARLLDDLLEASRVTQNKIELRRRIVDLGAIAREAADAVRGQMDTRGIHFTAHVPAEPVYVDGDPARLQQIQVNLLNNAAKYTPRGGHVTLQVSHQDGAATVRVTDDGMGIPRHMLDSVFELFVQSSRTLDRAAGGLGVGLTLVRSLVTMHGGTVVAHSDGEGRGSEFVVRLPLATAGTLADPAGARERRPLRDGLKIVVVEDNADSRELLCELLGQAGFECRAAENGVTALALVEEFRPDIAILDLGLPGMDGLEVARRLRGDPRHTGIGLIALTGYGQAADRATAHEAGFDEHLVKPVQGEHLLALLAEMRVSPGPA